MSGVNAMMGAASLLRVTIGAGQSLSGANSGDTFASNTATVAGGSGLYSYTWSISGDDFGIWSCGTPSAQSTAVTVAGVGAGQTSRAVLSCTVKDLATGITATSYTSNYAWTRT